MVITSIKNSVLLVLFFVIFYGCENTISFDDHDNESIHGSGRITTESRHVDNCSGISIQGSADVYLTQDSEQSIRIEADDNIIDRVLTEEQNGTLIVKLRKGSYSDITIRVYVSLKDINNISIEGAGNIVTRNQVESNDLHCTITGAGNIELAGYGNHLDCIINGAGKIDAEKYFSNRCKAIVNGAGKCIVYANEELDAYVNGVGSIYYYGNPENIHSSIAGVGLIVKK